MQVAGTSAMHSKDRAERAVAINRLSRWVFPVAFALLIVASFWLF
jgi:hypothetical protein